MPGDDHLRDIDTLPPWVQYLDRRMEQGFARLHERLDQMNGRVRGHGERILVLEDRSSRAARAGGISGGVIGGAVIAVIETIKLLLGAK